MKSKQREINAFAHLTHVMVQGFWLIHQAAIAYRPVQFITDPGSHHLLYQ